MASRHGYCYKCAACGGEIEKDMADYTARKVGNRYYHNECYQNLFTQEDGGKVKIHKKAKSILAEDYSYSRVERQIDELVSNGRTLGGILKTLEYWYDVRHNDPSLSNGGIGIVDYVYAEAAQYYKRLKDAKERYENVSSEDVNGYQKLLEVREVPTKKGKFQKPKRTNYVVLD